LPICTIFGVLWNSCVSASISFDSVALNSSVWRFFGSALHDAANVRQEAHVQHAIRLAEHEVLQLGEVRRALAHQV